MQRGEDQVAGQCCPAGDFGGFGVPDLPDQNHIGVLAENRSEASGEGQAYVRIDLQLIEPRIVILDRVLHRDDVRRGGLDPIEDAVERGGLAAAGGPVTTIMPLWCVISAWT